LSIDFSLLKLSKIHNHFISN